MLQSHQSDASDMPRATSRLHAVLRPHRLSHCCLDSLSTDDIAPTPPRLPSTDGQLLCTLGWSRRSRHVGAGELVCGSPDVGKEGRRSLCEREERQRSYELAAPFRQMTLSRSEQLPAASASLAGSESRAAALACPAALSASPPPRGPHLVSQRALTGVALARARRRGPRCVVGRRLVRQHLWPFCRCLSALEPAA